MWEFPRYIWQYPRPLTFVCWLQQDSSAKKPSIYWPCIPKENAGHEKGPCGAKYDTPHVTRLSTSSTLANQTLQVPSRKYLENRATAIEFIASNRSVGGVPTMVLQNTRRTLISIPWTLCNMQSVTSGLSLAWHVGATPWPFIFDPRNMKPTISSHSRVVACSSEPHVYFCIAYLFVDVLEEPRPSEGRISMFAGVSFAMVLFDCIMLYCAMVSWPRARDF